ncbi:hypothetical protein NDU88_006812 [Pleurodeles waltl]|uniref:Uncharacterized protein n=1 Tax=Pleurodeles waltl TaxID=8319 RepID=A0AAV7N0I6_PLEWA|nr:hypothetical protein NDU88_006812 [Pleurodeles waltl]
MPNQGVRREATVKSSEPRADCGGGRGHSNEGLCGSDACDCTRCLLLYLTFRASLRPRSVLLNAWNGRRRSAAPVTQEPQATHIRPSSCVGKGPARLPLAQRVRPRPLFLESSWKSIKGVFGVFCLNVFFFSLGFSLYMLGCAFCMWVYLCATGKDLETRR